MNQIMSKGVKMTDYGLHAGGGEYGLNTEDAFEMTVERVLGGAIRHDPAVASDMWCALANVNWRHVNGDKASYYWRSAGYLVAAIRGEGTYMDWYGSGPEGRVSDFIRKTMAAEGWVPDV